MKPTPRRCPGYSLIELLVVLVIAGILAGVGVMMIGDRRANAVRSVLDEVEGVLYTAQKASVTTSGDIYISTAGTWNSGSLIIDGRPLVIPAAPAPTWPTAADLTPGADATKRVGSSSECFRSRSPRDRDHIYAGIDVDNSWYATALGTTPALESVAPISGQVALTSALATPLFTLGNVIVNGRTKRFMTGFCVVIVALRDGGPVPKGPIGVLVVPDNSSAIYKFYKSDQSDVWRKI